MSDNRLRYLLYRCLKCKGLLTKLDILAAWEAAEADGVHRDICPCGGRQIAPTNATPEEEAKLGGKWQQFRYRVLGRDDAGTRLWKLYYQCVEGKELGAEYQGGSGAGS